MNTPTTDTKSNIDHRVAQLDLTLIRQKFERKAVRLGLSCFDPEQVEEEYRMFLTLKKRYPQTQIVPTQLVDEFWHCHILDTRAYERDCDSALGGFLHHFPYLGTRGPDDEVRLAAAFEETRHLFASEFGIDFGALYAGQNQSTETGSASGPMTLNSTPAMLASECGDSDDYSAESGPDPN
jgi:hypothetical protein